MTSSSDSLSLPFESIDDLIYFARVGDLEELQTTIKTLTTSHSSTPAAIISSAIYINPSDPGSSSNCSLLHWAAANNHVDVLRYLLTSLDDARTSLKQENAPTNGDSSPSQTFKPKQGGLVNVQNNSGNTALHWAALNGNLECVKLLVQAGADPGIRNNAGKDAVFEAERGELNKNGSEQETVSEGQDEKRKDPGVVEWLLDNCEGLDRGVGGSTEGETSVSVQDGENSMNVDG